MIKEIRPYCKFLVVLVFCGAFDLLYTEGVDDFDDYNHGFGVGGSGFFGISLIGFGVGLGGFGIGARGVALGKAGACTFGET